MRHVIKCNSNKEAFEVAKKIAEKLDIPLDKCWNNIHKGVDNFLYVYIEDNVEIHRHPCDLSYTKIENFNIDYFPYKLESKKLKDEGVLLVFEKDKLKIKHIPEILESDTEAVNLVRELIIDNYIETIHQNLNEGDKDLIYKMLSGEGGVKPISTFTNEELIKEALELEIL